MNEETTRRIAESIARVIDRRTFLKTASTVAFAAVVGLTTGKFAEAAEVFDNNSCNCNPPGPYCSNCHGADCYQNNGQECRLNRNYYPSGTWTSYCSGRGRTPGFYICTDCFCGPSNQQCGCRDYRVSKAPVTGPGVPANGTGAGYNN